MFEINYQQFSRSLSLSILIYVHIIFCPQLRQEKVELEQTLEQEQECLVNKLMRKIEKLETETATKQNDLETLRREKVNFFYFFFLLFLLPT